jgi:hypothetical protein
VGPLFSRFKAFDLKIGRDKIEFVRPALPSTSLYFRETCHSDILSLIIVPTNSNASSSGHSYHMRSSRI